MTALFEDGELAEAPEKIVVDAVAAYNAIAKRVNEEAKATIWCEARALTAKRRKRIKAAIPDYGGLLNFRKHLEDAARNNFLLGKEGRNQTHRNWQPDLDFFLQEKTIVKMLDGKYAPSVEVRQKLHIPMAYAPRKVEAPFVQTETLEQRLAASIVSYRRYGKWAEANRLEDKLAALENRPPVHVPAPEVARVGMPERPVEIPRRPSHPITDLEYDMEPMADDFGGE